jgi:hypothetical protein
MFGSYPLPYAFQVSGNLQSLPGIPILASYVATNAQIAPSLGRNLAAGPNGTALLTEAIGLIEPNTMFEDRINQLDIRFSRSFRVGRARMEAQFDIYNALNASPILSMNTRYGAAWLRPIQILDARILKFGGQVTF